MDDDVVHHMKGVRLQSKNGNQSRLLSLPFPILPGHRLGHELNGPSVTESSGHLKQLNYLDFAGGLALLSHTQKQMQ
ncbi:hypothetical protein DPMN_138950 [Dreissena polymorpha]|uniref:Uncharacterized protein n=1 Tax=Dreissena polymorpha TaxID=45954 RepID=A0A9D4G556_DREPO|nr:hypothetical protein DPMN_138950 [Dreissena polymorpha]